MLGIKDEQEIDMMFGRVMLSMSDDSEDNCENCEDCPYQGDCGGEFEN